jgi:hypothetical protein
MKRKSLEDPSLDTYTRFVLSHVEPEVIASLTEHQFNSIRDALEKSRPITRHPIDIRGILPLFFVRYYFVLLAGRDRRQKTGDRERGRRSGLSAMLGVSLLLTLVALPVTILMLAAGYALKTFLGIDLMPEAHLSDLHF